jgi:PAS domain S-box-containing protein
MAPSPDGIAELRAQLREAHETIEAIRGGDVDSLVIGPPGQEQVYTLASADRPYRLIVEAMSEGAATISPRGVILDVNPRLIAMTGQPGKQLIGASVLNLVPGACRPELTRLLDVGAGHSARGEVQLTGPDGSTVPVLLAVGGFDLDGMLLRCLVLTDLTAQRAAEDRAAQAHEALRQQNAVLEQAQETMGLGWWKLDPVPEGQLSWSSATYRIFGLDPAEFDGKLETFFRLVHPDDAPRVSAAVAAALESSSVPFRVEHRIVRPDGSVRWVQQSGAVERDDQGARRMLGICQDITDRKRIEAARRESQERLRVVFDTAPVGIYDMSPSGEFVRVNPRFCQITGYTAGELRSLRLHDVTPSDDLGADLAGLRRLVAGEIDTDLIEKRYLRKDGDVVWAEVSHAMVCDPDGNPMLIAGVARDITAQRAAEDKLRTLNAELNARVAQRTAELELANGSLQAFSYSVAHDLRAPLRALSGFSDALLEDYGDRLDETGRGYLGRIQAASQHMASLIDDLLVLSHVSRVPMNLEPVDLSAEAAAIAAELQSRDPGRRVRFTIADGVRATADRSLIRTVVQNLLENAWKFTAKRDGAVIEFASTAAEDGGVCCYVRDNGAGFDPAYGGKLFKPFERLHNASEFPGTGIGLASVARIVERHGGRVWAHGAVGHGATFYFTLGNP